MFALASRMLIMLHLGLLIWFSSVLFTNNAIILECNMSLMFLPNLFFLYSRSSSWLWSIFFEGFQRFLLCDFRRFNTSTLSWLRIMWPIGAFSSWFQCLILFPWAVGTCYDVWALFRASPTQVSKMETQIIILIQKVCLIAKSIFIYLFFFKKLKSLPSKIYPHFFKVQLYENFPPNL